MAGLLAAASPVLGALGGGGQPAGPDVSSAQATTTTTSTLSGGSMTQVSGLSLLIIGIVLYFLWKG
jgi:hypothetical protein